MSCRERNSNLFICVLVLLSSSIAMGAQTPNAGTAESQSSSMTVPHNDQEARAKLAAGYKEFIFGQGNADEQYQGAIQAGKKPLVSRFSYAKFTHTSEDAEEVIHSIIFTTYKSIRANDAQCESDIHSLQAQTYSAELDAKMQLRFEQRSKSEMAIVEQARAQLKNTLTQEDFQNLDWYVRTLERVGK